MGHFVWNYLNSFTRQHYVKASKGPWLLWKYHVVNGTGYSIYVQTYLEGCKINFLQFSNCVNNILLDDLGPINIHIYIYIHSLDCKIGCKHKNIIPGTEPRDSPTNALSNGCCRRTNIYLLWPSLSNIVLFSFGLIWYKEFYLYYSCNKAFSVRPP